jgi:hypothetical protein
MCYVIVLFYNVENSKNKEKNENVCPNFWLVLYILYLYLFCIGMELI